jgi:hypothetical protein
MSEKKYELKAYKGFNADMTCRGFQYQEGGEYEEETAELCNSGFHACELPHHALGYYGPGKSVYREVELGDVSDKKSDDSKRVGKRIKIGAQIDIWRIAEISVSAFFEWFGFDKKIKETEDAGDDSALQAGDDSALQAGYRSALRAGSDSALQAGDDSALQAGSDSALQAGDDSALRAGYRSALRAGSDSKLSAGEYSVVYGCGKGCKVSGGLHSVLALAITDERGRIIGVAHEAVDGERIKENTFYHLVDGKFVEVPEAGI